VPLESDDWVLVSSVRNPWGVVPMTNGGRHLRGRAKVYMDQLVRLQSAPDTPSRRHHYVPQSYLRRWSFDGKRVWALDTATGAVRPLGIASVCVEENFHRVAGKDSVPHNRVELLFGVVDAELNRVQTLFSQLTDPNTLEFDDLLGLGISMAVQRMRTAQQRRLQQQHNRWLVAQDPKGFQSIEDDQQNPHRLAGFHTSSLFETMWEAADVLTTRQIEIWEDTEGRFTTCDAPVMVPFVRNVRPSLFSSQYVIWPVSPFRAIALSNDLVGEKALIRKASGKMVGTVRECVEEGRERMIFATEDQRDRLPRGKLFRRRTQAQLRCSDRTPLGEVIPAPGCCVEWSEALAAAPDVALCSQGLHRPAIDLVSLA